MADASWTTTGKNCPATGTAWPCQDSACWALGEKPCKRWEAGERPPPPPVKIAEGIYVSLAPDVPACCGAADPPCKSPEGNG